jgi:hypothetical protein
MFKSDEGIAAALVHQGMIPAAPYSPQYAASIQVLKLYRNLRCHCPHLSIQPFLKGFLDMQGISNCHTLSQTLYPEHMLRACLMYHPL